MIMPPSVASKTKRNVFVLPTPSPTYDYKKNVNCRIIAISLKIFNIVSQNNKILKQEACI